MFHNHCFCFKKLPPFQFKGATVATKNGQQVASAACISLHESPSHK